MLIPDNIDDFNSNGERILYLKFKNDKSTNSFFVLHSLFTNYHLKNICGELDFLVLAPGLGVFAIEVKHGRVWRKDGTWYYEDRKGKITEKKISPFNQVDSTLNSIRDFVLKKLENNKILHKHFSRILFGTGVAFTSMTEFVDFGSEAHSWQIFTRSSLNYPIGYYIDALSKGWHNENSNKKFYDVNQSRPSVDDCKMILKILRGDFEVDYKEINRIQDHENLIEEFTKEQFSLLDFVNYNKRCMIQGNAGTGKTLMAIEIATRHIKADKKVGLFCYNIKLGDKLSESITLAGGKNKNYGGTLHSLMSKGTELQFPSEEADLQYFFSEALPFDFMIRNESMAENEKFDILIIDEAQDLVTSNYLEVFNSILKGGIKEGVWVLFGDFSNQAIYLNDPLSTIDLLSTKTSFTKFPTLKINCRNTKKISIQNTLLTGIDMPEFSFKCTEGEEIGNKFPTKNKENDSVVEVIENLLKRQIPLSKITLLSPKRFENTYLSDCKVVETWFSGGLTFSTIHSFKGLENVFIVLFDFDEIVSIESLRLLYIGISRAKLKLYMILNHKLESSYQDLIARNITKIS